MSEPTHEDLADTVTALYRDMRSTHEGVNELRDTLDFYSGSIIMLANLLVTLLALGLAILLLTKLGKS